MEVETPSINYTKTFTVNPYVTPQFEANLKTDKETYSQGENIKVEIDSKYFFGEPVKNAKVVLNINDKVAQEGITNEQGKFEYQYTAEKEGTLNIKAEVTDESNYLVESSKTVYISNDKLKVEIIPEYGKVKSNLDNDIYFFVKTPEGNGKKAYITVNMGKITRQVITDENGVGKISLTKTDISTLVTKEKTTKTTIEDEYVNLDNYLNLNLEIKDEDGTKVNKNERLAVQKNNSILIKTDKVKYNQQDDIVLTLESEKDIKDQTIAVCKNGEILKLITTDEEQVVVNLEDNYGLIDFYVLKNYNTKYKNQQTISKRTVFVKPNKALNVQVKTDSEIYKPKDNMNLNINLTDETGKTVDGALLVSILDEANLAIKDNDLSIDNIKISLQDIMLSDKLDGATFLTNVIDDKSESTLMAMLLKQESKDPNIAKETYSSIDSKEKSASILLIGIIVFILILLIYFSIKKEGVREALKHIIAFVGVNFVTLLILYLLDDIFSFGFNGISPYITGFIISLIVYILFLYKYKNAIFRLFIEYAILYVLILLNVNVIMDFESIFKWIIILIEIAILPVAFIASAILKKKNEKLALKIKKVAFEILKVLVIIGLVALSSRVSDIFAIIAFIALNIVYEIRFNKEYYKNAKTKTVKVTVSSIIGTVVLITILILALLFSDGSIVEPYNILSNGKSTTNSLIEEADDGFSDGANSAITPGVLDKSVTYGTAEKSNSKTLDSITDAFSKNKDKKEEQETKVEDEKETKVDDNSKNDSEENVRKIFLESMCFIPDMITQNGTANQEIKISDNITSWKIQVVGNTKQGNIGYGSSKITVKKDFFANFTLPTNCIIGDEIEIPVTVYNYMDKELDVSLDVTESDWFELKNYEKNIKVNAQSTKMVYIPISIKQAGEKTLQVKAVADGVEDILQKNMVIQNQGIQKTSVVSSGYFEKQLSQDIIYDVQAIDNTKKLKIKLYPNMAAELIEGLENILKMPTGCFEQTSSSLYPDVMILKYMQENNLINEEVKAKALSYISSGYQRLLTYEVKGTKGGYSLYGSSPAEPVLTAFGLMEMVDISSVYDVDSKVIENMKSYLYSKQASNGAFNNLNDSYMTSSLNLKNDKLYLNTYIIWALSEADSKDNRLNKSIKYLENNIDKLNDSYEIALAANAFANVGDNKNANILVERLLKQIKVENGSTYLDSAVVDYYGARGRTQNIRNNCFSVSSII